MIKTARFFVLAASVLGMAVSVPAYAAKAKKAAAANVIWPAADIKWEDGPAPGTHIANLWGNYKKGGPYGVLVKFDAGVMHDLHKHTQTLKTVIISGTFVFTPEGGTETKLGPGSYLLQKGGMKHISGCSADSECEFFMTSNDKFDMIFPKKPEKK